MELTETELKETIESNKKQKDILALIIYGIVEGRNIVRCDDFDNQLEQILTSTEFMYHSLIRNNFQRHPVYRCIVQLGSGLHGFFKEIKIERPTNLKKSKLRKVFPIEYVDQDRTNCDVFIRSEYFEKEAERLKNSFSKSEYNFLKRIGQEIKVYEVGD